MRRPLIGFATVVIAVALGAGLWNTRALHDGVVPPTGLSAKVLSPTSVEIDWKGSQDVDSYVVRIGADRALDPAETRKVAAGTTRLMVEDLATSTPGIDHFFRVDAVRDGAVTSSRIGRFVLKPARIGKVKVSRVATNGVKVSWKKVANSRQFDVSLARDKKFTKKLRAVRTISGSTTFTATKLSPATTYWIKVRPINSSESGPYSAPVKFTTAVDQTSFKVGTWNVCSEKCSGYAGRARIMAGFINANKIDMFGLQESGGQRVGATTNAIFSGGTQGFRRASGGAQARYIFYRPALFTQVSGSFFPIGDGRHATWAKFKVKQSGRLFFFVDVHLENGKGNDAKRAREMNVLVARMNAINDTGKPIIYVGDFNSGRHRPSDSPGAKMRAAGLADSLDLAESAVNAQISTSHTFSTTVLRARAHVDHIFVSKDFDVPAWAQLVRLSGNSYTRPVVSDHNLLSAVVSLSATTKSVGDPTPTTSIKATTP